MSNSNEGTPLVDTVTVKAPTDMEAGFVMDAMVGSSSVKVAVPDGGVSAGQVFQGKIVASSDMHYGSWRDGLFDCCRHGVFHGHLWLGMCFPLCLLGQVATRTGIWNESLPYGVSAYRLFFGITVVLIITGTISSSIQSQYGLDEDPEATVPFGPSFVLGVCHMLQFVLGLVALIATIRLRRSVRETYNIPASNDLEDCCCACCCQSCTICQLARHTADYNAVDAQLCTETGLPSHASSNTVIDV